MQWRDGLARRIAQAIYWFASVLAVIPLGVPVYVTVAEQRPFNWPVAGVSRLWARAFG
jgi:hypothetical protein